MNFITIPYFSCSFSPLPVLGERARVRGDRQSRIAKTNRHAFTLIEVLAAMMLMAIVLPPVMQGVAMATRNASEARHRTEAAGLAEEKLSEILATNLWQGGTLSGDFGTDWPAYHWQAAVNGWAADTTTQSIQQIDLTILWNDSTGRQRSVTLSTLSYIRTTTPPT